MEWQTSGRRPDCSHPDELKTELLMSLRNLSCLSCLPHVNFEKPKLFLFIYVLIFWQINWRMHFAMHCKNQKREPSLWKPPFQADVIYRTPAGSSTCNRWRSVRAVKWSPDEAIHRCWTLWWCVSVDFNVGFLIFGDLNVFALLCKSQDLAGNHRAWGVVWQGCVRLWLLGEF